MLHRLLLILTGLVFAGSALSGERVALVIGNSEYIDEQIADLPNSAQDAKDISHMLHLLGFRVTSGTDLT